MNVEIAKRFLLWSLVINYGVLVVWFVAFWFVHDWLFRLHGRWFYLSHERFDAAHYMGMAVYKIGILLFNLVPYIALVIVGRGG